MRGVLDDILCMSYILSRDKQYDVCGEKHVLISPNSLHNVWATYE